MKAIGFVLSGCLILLGSACIKSGAPTVSVAEQDIIETVIAQHRDSERSPKHALFQATSVGSLVFGEMTYMKLAEELRKEAKDRDDAFREALEDWIRLNATVTKLSFPRKLSESIVLAPNSDVQKIWDANSRDEGQVWAAIRARFPGTVGIFTVSRPGIDTRRTVALICVDYTTGSLSATGRFYILRFDGTKWVIQKDDFFGPSWMS